VVHGYPPLERGGVERVAAEQAEALAARGHRVAVFTRAVDPAAAEGSVRVETVGGVAVRRVVVHGRSRSPFREYYEGGFLDEAFRGFLEDLRPDVVHVQHLVGLSTRLVSLAREAGIPCVVSLHDAFYLCHRLFLLDRHGQRCPGPDAGLRCVDCLAEHGVGEAVRQRYDAMAKTLAAAEAVLAPSPSLARRYEEEMPFLAGRIEIVEPGLARVPAARLQPSRSSDGLRLLFIGTWLPHKGLDVLIEAVARLPAGRVQLEIRGAPVAGSERWLADLRERSASLPVAWRGEFPPEDLEDVLAAADVLVLPSRCEESWSRVAREARAAGLAVIATATGGPADWLEHERDALLTASASVEELASAIERLANDRALLEALSRPVDVPTVEVTAGRLERVFHRAIQRSSGRARERPRVTVAYVTKNGEPWIEDSLGAVRAQRGDFELAEILAIDSSSSDATVSTLERHGARVVRIPAEEFGHGRTRNLAAREARGDVVAFLTQDASPANERWLDELVRALVEDPLRAGVWSRHLPRPDCHPMERRVIAEHPPFQDDATGVRAARGNPDYTLHPEQYYVFSNNASAFRRDVLLRWPFPEVEFAEDQAWARRVLEAGWRTALVHDSFVRHSHAYTAWQNLRRHFDHARAMTEDLGQRDDFGLLDGWRASLREARRDLEYCARDEGRHPIAVGLRWGIPATLYHLGAFGGRWLGARAGALPRRLPAFLSFHESARGAR